MGNRSSSDVTSTVAISDRLSHPSSKPTDELVPRGFTILLRMWLHSPSDDIALGGTVQPPLSLNRDSADFDTTGIASRSGCQNPFGINATSALKKRRLSTCSLICQKLFFLDWPFRADKQRCRDSAILFDAVREDRQDASIRRIKTRTSIKLQELEQSRVAVLNSLGSVNSRRAYEYAIRKFLDWYCAEPRLGFNRSVVAQYRSFLEQQHFSSAPSRIAPSLLARNDPGILN